MKKFFTIVISLMVLMFFCGNVSFAEEKSMGKYYFGEIVLAFGAGWHVKLYNDEGLAKELKEMGVDSHILGILTKNGKMVETDRCTVFIEGENRDQIVVYSEFFQYNSELLGRFPIKVGFPSIDREITILGFYK